MAVAAKPKLVADQLMLVDAEGRVQPEDEKDSLVHIADHWRFIPKANYREHLLIIRDVSGYANSDFFSRYLFAARVMPIRLHYIQPGAFSELQKRRGKRRFLLCVAISNTIARDRVLQREKGMASPPV